MSPSAAQVHQAYVDLEVHRSAGAEQAPRCRCCGEACPCSVRVAAHDLVQSVIGHTYARSAVNSPDDPDNFLADLCEADAATAGIDVDAAWRQFKKDEPDFPDDLPDVPDTAGLEYP